jgi:hypothetical protein
MHTVQEENNKFKKILLGNLQKFTKTFPIEFKNKEE